MPLFGGWNPTGPTRCTKHRSFPRFLKAVQRHNVCFCFYNPGQPYEIRFHNYHNVYKSRDPVELYLDVYKRGDSIFVPIQTLKSLARFCMVVCTS